jgi:tetratricopeptide (TPR) repeat protein
MPRLLTEVRMGTLIRRMTLTAVLITIALWAAPAAAQTGQVKGKVVDAKNQPIEGAQVTIEMAEGMNRKYEVKTNRRGEFIQIGLQPGQYKITAAKDGMSQSFPQRIGLDMAEVNFTLKPGSTADVSDADRKKAEARNAAIRSAFDEGVKLGNEGKFDEAIAKFNEVIAALPKCAECYANIGEFHSRKKEYDQAEAAYKKAIEINPSFAAAYSGLATLYNQQKKFKEAQEMSALATKHTTAGGGTVGPETLVNQGVIAWNSNNFPEAQEKFEAAVKAKPDYADAHFMLGKVYINLGKLPEAATEFETYLKLAPTGPNAKEAQTNFDALKSYRK